MAITVFCTLLSRYYLYVCLLCFHVDLEIYIYLIDIHVLKKQITEILSQSPQFKVEFNGNALDSGEIGQMD